MLACTTVSHKFLLKTSTSADTDYYVVWSDQGATGGVGLASGTLDAVQTIDLVPSPAANYRRIVQAFWITNFDTSLQQEVTISFHDGTDASVIRSIVLYPGDTLQYDLRTGFTVLSRISAAQTIGLPPALNQLQFLTLGAIVPSNATANVLTDIPALDIPVLNGGTYKFLFTLIYTANATATGSRFSLTGPAGIILYDSEYSLSATTTTRNTNLSAFNLPATTNATSGAVAGNVAYIRGVFKPSANGNLTPRFASEVAGAGSISVLPGSTSEWLHSL